ncbi:MAG: hypothetical protein LAO51_14760 [Acidobacteriia bacterium]|nr:hypothetical protein [Terriglobia bacterium]
MLRGLTGAPWSWGKDLAQRLFPMRETPPETWKELYDRWWITPAVGNSRRHDLIRAY